MAKITLYNPLAASLWDDGESTWDKNAAQWDTTRPPIKSRGDTLTLSATPTQTFARINSRFIQARQNSVSKNNAGAALISTAWHALSQTHRDEWNDIATERREFALIKRGRATSVSIKKSTRRSASGFALFTQEYFKAGKHTPLQPNDPARTQPVMLIELLTGADFEQRFCALIDDTTGPIRIAVYQASANWSQGGVPKSLVYTKLLSAAQMGRACKIIMAQPLPNSPALTFNITARAEMEAAGWSVRFAPPIPPLHAKIYLLAPWWSIVGSHNLSNRAATGNIEASILTNKVNLFEQLSNLFTDLFALGA